MKDMTLNLNAAFLPFNFVSVAFCQVQPPLTVGDVDGMTANFAVADLPMVM
jgi:hypothetical protein